MAYKRVLFYEAASDVCIFYFGFYI